MLKIIIRPVLLFLAQLSPVQLKTREMEEHFAFSLKVHFEHSFKPHFDDNIRYGVVAIRTSFLQSYGGHLSTGVPLTNNYVLTSALPIESINEEYQLEMGSEAKDLWEVAGGLTIYYSVLTQRYKEATNHSFVVHGPFYGNVSEVIFYPGRPKLRTFDNPSLTKDDLALLRYNRSDTVDEGFICRIKPAYQIYEFPENYYLWMLPLVGFTISGMPPTAGVKLDAQVKECKVGKYWGQFICMNSTEIAYGPDSGSPLLSENNTLVGIASFTLSMLKGINHPFTYYTNISYILYQNWIDKTVFAKNVTFDGANEQTNDFSNDCGMFTLANGTLQRSEEKFLKDFSDRYSELRPFERFSFTDKGGYGERNENYSAPFNATNTKLFYSEPLKKNG